jgi:hypothetical protein
VNEGILPGDWNPQGRMEVVYGTENTAGVFAVVAARNRQLHKLALHAVFVGASGPQRRFLNVSSSSVEILTELVQEPQKRFVHGVRRPVCWLPS